MEQLMEMFGSYGYLRLRHWMTGQTMSICDGRTYDHDSSQYFPTECVVNPHGPVVYIWDLKRFVSQPDPKVWD